MNVRHVIPSVARIDGGPSEVLRGLLPALRDRGVDARLTTTDARLDPAGADADLRLWDGVTIVPAMRPTRYGFGPGLPRQLERDVRDAELVHVHGMHTLAGSLALAAARRHGKPVVLQPHGSLDPYQLARHPRRKNAYLASVDRYGLGGRVTVLVSSEAERAGAARRLPRADIAIVPLGIDEGLFELPVPREREPVIGFVGRIAEKKRLDLLLRAFAALPASTTARLVVAGPTMPGLSYEPSELAVRLQIAHRVEFLGVVDADARRRALSRTRIFVLASDDESFGVAAAEAMAAGCAVVLSSEVGIAAGAAAAGAAIVVERRADAIAEALGRLLRDDDESERLASAARAYARANFTWANAAARTERVYADAITGAAS